MKWILIVIVFLIPLSIGVSIGYRIGLDNQVYFDAPAKIVLYSSILENGKEKEYFKGQIIQQIRILNEPEYSKYKSELLLWLPPHGGEFRSVFQQYSSEASTKPAYKEALEFLCKHNEEYNLPCE
ncbi:MAG: hypothetical protein JAZ06_00815 [Candidatus Thiodiazotropha taylori]|nr:hypothetical protein [Candidatus Thiodiazotropha taylori]